MAAESGPDSPPDPPPIPTDGGHGDLIQLQKLLFGLDSSELQELRERIENPANRTEAVAEVLAEAVTVRTAQDDRLGVALGGTIQNALNQSITRNPGPVANAIYPVIGPSIRKAISAAIAGMVQSLNQSIEHSVSWKAMRWRFEAWRSGTPFAEYLLLRTLVYRVEQLFLIHSETGLVLQHVSVDPENERDPDMVSGMLTAIQDFLRDSFARNDGDGLTSMSLDEGDVLIERGAHAVLAAVVRGSPPAALRPRMQETVEQVHLQRGALLLEYDGDSTPFETVRPVLEECLMQQTQEEEERGRRRPWPALAVIAVVLAALFGPGIVDFFSYHPLDNALRKLSAEPGYVVIEARANDDGVVARGLRDPDARAFEQVMGCPEDVGTDASELPCVPVDPSLVSWSERPYVSLDADDRLVLARAQRLLAPPAEIKLSYSEETATLSANGEASAEWFDRASLLAPGITGVAAWHTAALKRQPSGAEELRVLTDQVAATDVLFESRVSELNEVHQQRIEAIARRFVRIEELHLQLLRPPPRLHVIGGTDASGSTLYNQQLALERGRAVMDALTSGGVPEDRIDVSGNHSSSAPNEADARRVRIFVR